MSMINGVPMQNISEIDTPKYVFDQCLELIKRMAEVKNFNWIQRKKNNLIV